MNVLVSLLVVGALFGLGMLGAVPGMGWVGGVVIPYAAAALFIGGLVHRVLSWANVPVPFRIPTTCGQQKSLPWIKHDKLANPHNGLQVFGRMLFEVLFFRSLLRNTKTRMVHGDHLVHRTDLALWIAALAMHWSLLIILLRHMRLFLAQTPACIAFLQSADGFFEIGVPEVYITSILFLAGLTYLLLRRFGSPQVRYISLVGDYFPLFLMLGIGITGVCMRHLTKTDIAGVKELALGLVAFSPAVPAGISPLFFGHLMLVSVLAAYFPFSKLSHMAGIFLSPTRNMANNNRAIRHVNPWDYPVKVHSYEDYEDELRDKMVAAGIPVER